MREVDALKATLAFLAHCVKLPVPDAGAAEVCMRSSHYCHTTVTSLFSCLAGLLHMSVRAVAMREVDALKAALAFLAHCVKLPVPDAGAAEVCLILSGTCLAEDCT